ncbi:MULTISPECIES: HD domain-containing protein [Methanococcoides]|jgi:(p)ppGpp synthase/HD superfamily hydrolase|uniref:Bifunctional (P)ppGpp synthetase/guanosine-3',5'-bis(Diphosphate) 3'-pyrophosphohydrolase n=1 Tax=Methanococcoides seepicolus TaxID=2828780 RepID=A0A9E4ZGR1_9EURY|nr:MULTISPECIES: HD domain-containing protein [Methanococcoides]MCM1987377.1 bifunctional (p)ppGpp synthetase/guanosine-3',5'-bis(diphosphate) 3'-pyrophosphohydrolase [Methanococcoides seepicolus]
MKIREIIIKYCDNTEKKGNGLLIHSGHPSEEIELPELFMYIDDWSEEPSRKIWRSDVHQMIVIKEDGKFSVYEHARMSGYRIQLLELDERYGEKVEKDLTELGDVFAFVNYAHRKNKRKSGTPFITHPIDVASILIKENASTELIFAGLLHDIVEDADFTPVDIRRRYGPLVGDYVNAVTEPTELRQGDGAVSWKARKEYMIKSISRAMSEVKLLSCADKLANLRELIQDLERDGESVWERFNAPKDEQEWYYSSMLEAFTTGPQTIADTFVFKEYKKCVEQLF